MLAVQQSIAVTRDESMESFSDSYEEDVNKSLLNLSTVSHVLNHIESKFFFIRCCQLCIVFNLGGQQLKYSADQSNNYSRKLPHTIGK